ncbi:trafficking protein particle complex subunit 10 [Bombina bombina]|uniref:trafficking protein particle complex subunit 10 n=1 Tax=Bombina bombina TaxID=8345 RepID=UPI00235A7AD7|nr:trafficking protein particle complex subunit 10 [Bombina bombina]
MEGEGPADTGSERVTGELGVVYTMENKPIVTCAGDQNLFAAVYPNLTQQLPREPMEWRRSYGRAPKMIHLESNFVQFKEELLPKEGNKALLTFPFLHIYWTECCDTEVYKANTKDDITKWQNALRAHSTSDWLIVVVETEAKKKNKTNILPRTSIADKIRSDFCNKQSDRCMVLVDPLKDTLRSQEAWSIFLSKLRTLLLTSFTRNLGHFEDEMRTLREKRTEPAWSFCDYFMVQEELAFVFEMLQQFEDALVQYDELDALFSQYVLNFGAGDGANWLSSFCQPVQSWDGLALRKPIDMEKRELIQRHKATLLDLRSYLFSRQCTLLLFLQRPWEVANRALELLHNCVQELKLLEVSVPPGALDCWVFLSCLEVLQRIEGCCEQAQIDANISHMVGLWSYATEKLQSLGSLCGLVSETAPSSEDLQRTVDLLAGLGTERPETANTAHSPYKKLQEALSSQEAFERHYLELSHATIEMYNSIGRTRSAKLIGKDLAEFYMKKSAPQKAEPFLQGALKMYQTEAWALPLTHTRKQLAECQRQLRQIEPYLQTCCLLAADVNLSQEERAGYCKEILTFAEKSSGTQVRLPLSSFAQLTSLRFEPANAVVHVGGSLSLELTLNSMMPQPVQLEYITGHLHYSLDKNSYRKTAEWLMRHKPANSTVVFPSEGPLGASGSSPALELAEMYEKSPSDGGLVSTGVICKNVHMLLRQQEQSSSSSPLDRHGEVNGEDSTHTLRCSNVTLQPGLNHLTFCSQSRSFLFPLRKYIQVRVENSCVFHFQLSDSCLSSSRDIQLRALHPADKQDIQSQQCVYFVWEVMWCQEPPASISCNFSVSFLPAPSSESCAHLQPFTYLFHLEHFYTLYTVRAEITPPTDAEYCKTASLCSLEVCITRLCDPVETEREDALSDCEGFSSMQLFYQVVDSGSNWAVCGRSSGTVIMPVSRGACHMVRMEVMPLFAGYLPYPEVRLFKYLPHHSQQLGADSWIENDSVSVEDPCEAPSGQVRSINAPPGPTNSSSEQKGLPLPRLQPFHTGQVNNDSAGRQILVLPSTDDHVLEVNVT